MKKIAIYLFSSLFVLNIASAEGFKIGISGTGAEFSDAKGTEIHKAVSTSETDTLAAAYGSIFVEANVMDMFSVGLDYIPYALEGETVSNARRTGSTVTGTTSFSVDIENHATLYTLVPLGDTGAYGKIGVSYADVVVNESTKAGTTYPDAEMLGGHISLGYEKNFSEFFVRGEAGLSEYETVTSKSSSGNTTVKAALGGGVHARISIGKSF